MPRRRVREWGIRVGTLPPGRFNHLVDVPGVSVGHVTLWEGDAVRTGVTAILPHGGNWFREKVPAAAFVLNGFGKTVGLVQVKELGLLEGPILLTNTFGVAAALEGALRYMLAENPDLGEAWGSINLVVAECNDSWLHDMRGLHVRPEHAMAAIAKARAALPLLADDAPLEPGAAARRAEALQEGAVGAGTGMVAFGWKGGIGSASRRIAAGGQTFHVGVLALCNFGRREDLIVSGVPVGRLVHGPDDGAREGDAPIGSAGVEADGERGSVIVVVATDAPLLSRQLRRVAKRAALGLARVGGYAYHGSGDIVLAFSTGLRVAASPSSEASWLSLTVWRDDDPAMNALFRAAVEATEEAVLNALFVAETVTGKGGRVAHALPAERVAAYWHALFGGKADPDLV
ncbi:DmpA family aminopeptidase [Calditerricola satsumensis]|uniref:Aminopeptidase n=2 Tax=Calditerricola satsumensis TaxID=373054 RepID=A0A8J3BBR0_9BACI|nr:P1 family peptidase [Calditerricola satsumensis]GGK03320.1 aminopeptidase [Calditerricola satsumensis]